MAALKRLYRMHAVQRMFEREISANQISKALEHHDVVEDYSSEMPNPSLLILDYKGARPFHVVTSDNLESHQTTVITVYIPSSEKWKKDFRTRR